MDLLIIGGTRFLGRHLAALNTCAYFPRQVRALADQLAGQVGQYQLVSSISAYGGLKVARARGGRLIRPTPGCRPAAAAGRGTRPIAWPVSPLRSPT